ncbi:MAG: putative lipid II flippase FtsW [Candidatus Parcubacteria bacterium]|nr:putative lipid II flippase FtsW [Candidatus Parcubacteria bacterium]
MRFFTKNWHQPDYGFIIILFLIVVFGLVMLSSASVSYSFEKYQDSYFILKHQLIWGLLPGIFAFVLFSILDYKIFKKLAFWMLAISLAMLLLVFIPGIGADYGSAKSWIYIFGVSFQPSELVKLTFLIYLASWLDTQGHKKAGNFYEGLMPFLCILILIVVLLVLQPDLGTMTIIALMALTVYFIGGANLLHMIGVAIGSLAGLFVLIKIAPYRAARFTIFLHPELDPQGIGYHINQAFLAIGSGGFWGRGFGMSRQKFQYLPEVAGDSIFAIIAEELGFIFSSLLIIGYLFLMSRGLKIAQKAPDNFGKHLVIGVIAWILIQSFVNISAMVGLLPLTGVPLPFVSYGGTSMMVLLAACGIVVNVSRQTRE